MLDNFLPKIVKKEIINDFEIYNNDIYYNKEIVGKLEFKNNFIYVDSFLNFNLKRIFEIFPKYQILINRDKDYSSKNYKNKRKLNPITIKNNIYNSGLYLIKN